MTNLPPEARDLIGQARAQQAPSSPAKRARVRAAVERTLALSAVSTLDPAQPPVPTGTSLSLAKLAATLVSIAGIASVFVMFRPGSPHAAKLVVRPSTAPVEQVVVERAEPLVMDVVPQPTVPLSTPAPIPRVPRDSLAAEMSLLKRADHELRLGHAEVALHMLKTERRQLRGGQLVSEREGLQLLAECTLHLPGAQQRAATYLRSESSSLVRSRLSLACQLEEPKP